ncbi:5' nucleotidase, NT5C type [Halovenus sp. HT40]|uniref:5' nucleotidase, NT5C type n=1 Tax=Halovenus sp. HT40 TaxID=3126691 RepID=UPI00300F6E6B
MLEAESRQILVDVDGTLCFNLPRLCEFLEVEYGIEITREEITDWSYQFEQAGVGIEEVITQLFEEYPEWFLADLDPVPGAGRALDSLAAAGYEIQIVTHRPPETHHLTQQWLDERGMHYDGYVEDVPANKAEVPGDVLIDDFHGHVADAVDAGMYGLLFDRPYTESVGHERMVRVSTWADVLDAFGIDAAPQR